VGVVNQSVKERVGDGRVAYHLMPVLHRQLTGNDGGRRTIPVFHHFQEVPPLRIGEGRKGEIIEDENRHPCEPCQGF